MGLFDSFYTKCPKCKRQLEFQSKSGECMCSSYTEKDLSSMVAIGMDGDVVMCEFCKINWKLVCDIPPIVKTTLIQTKEKKNYSGNHNPKLPENIKRDKELKRIMRT